MKMVCIQAMEQCSKALLQSVPATRGFMAVSHLTMHHQAGPLASLGGHARRSIWVPAVADCVQADTMLAFCLKIEFVCHENSLHLDSI